MIFQCRLQRPTRQPLGIKGTVAWDLISVLQSHHSTNYKGIIKIQGAKLFHERTFCKLIPAACARVFAEPGSVPPYHGVHRIDFGDTVLKGLGTLGNFYSLAQDINLYCHQRLILIGFFLLMKAVLC